MKLSECLDVRFICVDLKSQNKEDAINELAARLREAPGMLKYEHFVRDVLERENMMSTGIGNGIAVPHARTDAVEKLLVAIGRSNSGIDFKSSDGQPSHLVFLMGTPSQDVPSYLRLLANLTKALTVGDFRQKLLDAKTPEEIVEIFTDREKQTATNGH